MGIEKVTKHPPGSSLLKKEHEQVKIKGMDTKTLIISQCKDLLSHAHYRDAYFDFMVHQL